MACIHQSLAVAGKPRVLMLSRMMLPQYKERSYYVTSKLLCRTMLSMKLSASRLQRRGSQILIVYLGWFVLQAALAYARANSHGIEGVAFGWMAANAVRATAA